MAEEHIPLEQSPLWMEIRPIMEDKAKPVKYEYRGMLHTTKEDIPIFKIVSIDVVRDYTTCMGDRRHIEFKMALGDYITRMYPYRTNLELSVKRIQLEETSGQAKEDAKIETERYKAVFLPKANIHPSGTELEQHDTESMNKVDLVDVKLDLLDRSLEPLRVKTTSGVFRNATAHQLMHSVMVGESNKIKVDGKPAIDGIDIVKPHNQALNRHIILKSGQHITDIPSHLQEHMNGVYNAGIGTYLQKYKDRKLWFVYPLWSTKRFDEDVPKVVFYAVPAERFPSLDRTYREEGKILKILVSSRRKYFDSAETDHMNNGSGFKQADANAFMRKPVKITDEGPVGMRANLNTELAARQRDDGLNYAPVSDRPISSNVYTEYSKVNARNIARIDLTWENAQHDLICPGMPCKYIHLNKNKLVEVKGVVLFVHAMTSLQVPGMSNIIYRNICTITIGTEISSHRPDIPTAKTYGVY
jgi:hypothetical protein